ncbi:hypothetical protein NEILACOT_04886 [Neisseria lactamica ATCC 23970]|uniref:Uncharacterized protein n=1 Tax=Neisseria lactamica ATCC 23970 TaxID=546265 RepID=D0WBG0_NEILA|nr:hypothetical protein NEILACOT_04886 [Neisseria lactamica ATCC 23970]
MDFYHYYFYHLDIFPYLFMGIKEEKKTASNTPKLKMRKMINKPFACNQYGNLTMNATKKNLILFII